MGLALAQILPVDGDGTHDPVLLHGAPYLVAGLVQPANEFRQTAGHLAFKERSEAGMPGIETGMHFRHAANHPGL
jgi:hypothetical protein